MSFLREHGIKDENPRFSQIVKAFRDGKIDEVLKKNALRSLSIAFPCAGDIVPSICSINRLAIFSAAISRFDFFLGISKVYSQS